jgi:DNA/RNA-binding domain of Phe-tRNA-synthetase-like protein
MHFHHTPAIWAEFPQLVPGIMLVRNIRPDLEVSERLLPYFERARSRLATGSESELAEIQAWRRAFSQMGMKPTQYRSAAEALLRRFRKEDTLPTLHPLVDLCNAVSLAYALPVAVIDLEHVIDWIEVRHAIGTEIAQAFSGETEHPEPGEVIFADAAERVHARRWTFRQSRHSTVTQATTHALIISEGLHTTASTDVAALVAQLEAELHAIGFAPSRRTILTAEEAGWEAL